MKYLLSLLCFCCFVTVARAQETITENEEPQYSDLSADSLSVDVGLIPESLDADVDSLLHSWHVQYFSKKDEYCHDDAANVWFPDSVYRERLESLPRVISLPYNKVVRDCIVYMPTAVVIWYVICWVWRIFIFQSSNRFWMSMTCQSN